MPPRSYHGRTAFEAELTEIEAQLRARPPRPVPDAGPASRGLGGRRLALLGALPLAAAALTLLRPR